MTTTTSKHSATVLNELRAWIRRNKGVAPTATQLAQYLGISEDKVLRSFWHLEESNDVVRDPKWRSRYRPTLM